MRKNILVLLLSAIFILSTVSGAAYYELYYPGQARIPESSELATYIDGLPWSNGTLIQWGDVDPGLTYTKNLTVVNTGTTSLTVCWVVSGLAPGWDLTWAANGTDLDPSEAAIGDLSLEVPSNGTGAVYSWDQWIRGS